MLGTLSGLSRFCVKLLHLHVSIFACITGAGVIYAFNNGLCVCRKSSHRLTLLNKNNSHYFPFSPSSLFSRFVSVCAKCLFSRMLFCFKFVFCCCHRFPFDVLNYTCVSVFVYLFLNTVFFLSKTTQSGVLYSPSRTYLENANDIAFRIRFCLFLHFSSLYHVTRNDFQCTASF